MWFAVIIVAVLAFFFTDEVLIATILAYALAVWPCARSAFWLRSSDHLQARGRACFWFYLAAAAWEAAAHAWLSIVVFELIEAATGNQPTPATVAQIVVAFILSLVLASILGFFGVCQAYRSGTKVCVVPDLVRLCRGDFALIATCDWRPSLLNLAVIVVAGAIFPPILVLGAVLCIIGFLGPNPNDPSMLAWIGLAMVMIGPFVLIVLHARIADRVVARTPDLCWPDLYYCWPYREPTN